MVTAQEARQIAETACIVPEIIINEVNELIKKRALIGCFQLTYQCPEIYSRGLSIYLNERGFKTQVVVGMVAVVRISW